MNQTVFSEMKRKNVVPRCERLLCITGRIRHNWVLVLLILVDVMFTVALYTSQKRTTSSISRHLVNDYQCILGGFFTSQTLELRRERGISQQKMTKCGFSHLITSVWSTSYSPHWNNFVEIVSILSYDDWSGDVSLVGECFPRIDKTEWILKDVHLFSFKGFIKTGENFPVTSRRFPSKFLNLHLHLQNSILTQLQN